MLEKNPFAQQTYCKVNLYYVSGGTKYQEFQTIVIWHFCWIIEVWAHVNGCWKLKPAHLFNSNVALPVIAEKQRKKNSPYAVLAKNIY
jgi:hypothetical protein